MTRKVFNEMFDKYETILSKYSYDTLYNICWNGKLKNLLDDNCKVTYCGYSVINFTNGYFNYTLYANGTNWKLETHVGACVEKDDNGCNVTFYRDKDWDDNTEFRYCGCYTKYPYKCRDGFYFTIDNVVYVNYFEDNHNASLLAMKYGISIEMAREYTYGE